MYPGGICRVYYSHVPGWYMPGILLPTIPWVVYTLLYASLPTLPGYMSCTAGLLHRRQHARCVARWRREEALGSEGEYPLGEKL